MKANHILVDFENVPHLPLDRIDEDHVVFAKRPASSLVFSETGIVTNADEPKASGNT